MVCAADVPTVNPTTDPAKNRLDGYQFDNAGNTKTDANGRQFLYDGEGKQIVVKESNNTPVGEYYYDGDGKRVKKIGYTSGQPTETTIFVYDAAGKLVAEYANQISTTPQVSYLTNDNLGSPRINTDANGAVISRHDYQPFGEEVMRTSYGSDEVRKQFGTYQRDRESDLDYAQARYYNKNLGRFNSVDPIMMSKEHPANPQRWNAYVYVLNCPTTAIDPDGKRPKRTIDIFITLFNDEITKEDRAEIKKLRKEAAKQGVKINVYERDKGTATAEKFIDSIQTKGRTTILIGHSAPTDESLAKGVTTGRYYGAGIKFGGGSTLSSQDNVEKGLATDTLDGTYAKAKNVAVLTCDFGPIFNQLNSTNNTNFLSIDNGENGESTVSSGFGAGIAIARVIANGGNAQQAKVAAQRVFDNSSDSGDAGDKIVLRVIKPN